MTDQVDTVSVASQDHIKVAERMQNGQPWESLEDQLNRAPVAENINKSYIKISRKSGSVKWADLKPQGQRFLQKKEVFQPQIGCPSPTVVSQEKVPITPESENQ